MKNSIKNTFTLLFVLTFSVSFAQTIQGVVSTNENIPLEAANIVIKGTTSNTTTDASGKYNR